MSGPVPIAPSIRVVPDISFGRGIVGAVRRMTRKPLNVHLMVVEPERSLEGYAAGGTDHQLVQAEPGSTTHLHRVLGRVRELGCRSTSSTGSTSSSS